MTQDYLNTVSDFVTSLSIGDVSEVAFLNKGVQNTIYKVSTSKGVFCIRIYNKRTKDQIDFEVRVLDYAGEVQRDRMRDLGEKKKQVRFIARKI